jgi:hypothetical protein
MRVGSLKNCICGKSFKCYVSFQIYCSPECRRQNEPFYRNRQSIKKICPACLTPFETFRKNKIYCTAECQIANKRKTKLDSSSIPEPESLHDS